MRVPVPAIYHGSLRDFHGPVLVQGPCHLVAGNPNRFHLTTIDGQNLLNVRPASFTMLVLGG